MADARPRLLLLTGVPPGAHNVGGIILGDLVRHYGPGRVRCAAIVGRRFVPQPTPGLQGMTMQLLPTLRMHARRRGVGRLAAFVAAADFVTGFQRETARLASQIVAGCRADPVAHVFAVLDNPLVIAIARRVAGKLGVPMTTLVWDPPDYLLRTCRYERFGRGRLVAEFRRCLRASSAVAVVSEAMQRDFAEFTGAPIHLLRHGLPAGSVTAVPTTRRSQREEWVLGFAGSMYSDCAWRALLAALDSVAWRIAGRPVRLQVMAAQLSLHTRHAAVIEFLGFRDPADVQRILGECDACYMPQPFVPELGDLCRYSFPTKLANYLATGRPVFVHAPADSSLQAYYAGHPFGASCDSLEPGSIVAALEGLLGDEATYVDACRRAAALAATEFGEVAFLAAVDRVLPA